MDIDKQILASMMECGRLEPYSTKNQISLIIQKKNVVIGKSELDITKIILDLLNDKIKKVELK